MFPWTFEVRSPSRPISRTATTVEEFDWAMAKGDTRSVAMMSRQSILLGRGWLETKSDGSVSERGDEL